jgi:hypothetical protein
MCLTDTMNEAEARASVAQHQHHAPLPGNTITTEPLNQGRDGMRPFSTTLCNSIAVIVHQ